ncbi:MAG: hypothetical protein IKE34_13095, partial [Paenibacillus sp.]|nr:hypothetical protein [Paenibacillus sp.]
MKGLRKVLALVLVVGLISNLWMFPSMVQASNHSVDSSLEALEELHTLTTPLDEEAQEQKDGTGIIQENIITNVSMKDKEGNRIETIRPEQGSRVQIDFDWKLPMGHGYTEGAEFTFQLPEQFRLDRVLTGEL